MQSRIPTKPTQLHPTMVENIPSPPTTSVVVRDFFPRNESGFSTAPGVIDVVQAAAYLGQAVVFLYKDLTKHTKKNPRRLVPIGSMYGIFTYIWLIFMVNVAKSTIHGSYGVGWIWNKKKHRNLQPKLHEKKDGESAQHVGLVII